MDVSKLKSNVVLWLFYYTIKFQKTVKCTIETNYTGRNINGFSFKGK